MPEGDVACITVHVFLHQRHGVVREARQREWAFTVKRGSIVPMKHLDQAMFFRKPQRTTRREECVRARSPPRSRSKEEPRSEKRHGWSSPTLGGAARPVGKAASKRISSVISRAKTGKPKDRGRVTNDVSGAGRASNLLKEECCLVCRELECWEKQLTSEPASDSSSPSGPYRYQETHRTGVHAGHRHRGRPTGVRARCTCFPRRSSSCPWERAAARRSFHRFEST